MNLEEAIKYANNMTKTKYHHGMVQMGNLNDDEANFYFEEAKSYKQLAKWLEELKDLREYKEKYRWHDIRKNPDDIPDVEHRKKEYFHVVQEGKETGPTILQYKKDFGFGFYNDFGNGPKFTEVDTNFTAPIVAWKEIEKFESEGENADTSRR